MSRGIRASRALAALLVVAMLGVNVGCAHKQLTNRQLAVGGAAIVGLGLLLFLAVHQCQKGASYCDNSPAP
jgi:hypothetical protein